MKIAYSKKFQGVATKSTKHKQPKNETNFFFEMEYFPYKKNRSWSDSNTGPLPSQTKCARKFEFIMNQDTR